MIILLHCSLLLRNAGYSRYSYALKFIDLCNASGTLTVITLRTSITSVNLCAQYHTVFLFQDVPVF